MTEDQRRSFNAGRTGHGTPLFDKNFDRTAYDNGRMVRAYSTPWLRGNQQNSSPSDVASGPTSPLSIVVGLFLLGVLFFVVIAVFGIVTAPDKSQKAENFMQAQEPPPRPRVYEPRRISSTPVLIGPEGVQLRTQPDFEAKPSACPQCPPGPPLANMTVMMNGEYNGWVHLVADLVAGGYVAGYAPPGSDIRPIPSKQVEMPPDEPSTDQTTVGSSQPLPNVRRSTSPDPR